MCSPSGLGPLAATHCVGCQPLRPTRQWDSARQLDAPVADRQSDSNRGWPRTVRGGAWRGLPGRRSEAPTAVEVRRRLESPQEPRRRGQLAGHARRKRERASELCGSAHRVRATGEFVAQHGLTLSLSPSLSLSLCRSLTHTRAAVLLALPFHHSISSSQPCLTLSLSHPLPLPL